MKIKPLTKIDVTRYRRTNPWLAGLIANGFRFKFDGRRVFLVRQL